MKNIIDKYYIRLRLSSTRSCALFDLNSWYIGPYECYHDISNLEYDIRTFIRIVNTPLHLRIAKRLSLGLDVYGKET